jgi:hypothetical protein
MNHTLITEIKNKLFTKTNKINSAILRRTWFTSSELYKNIINNTKFLNTTNISERIYCLINNINESPKCPNCNSILQFKTYQDGYFKSCNSSECKRSIYHWDSCSKTKINNNIKIKTDFITEYHIQNFPIINCEDIIKFINKRNLETNYGVKHQFINIDFLQKEKDILYNILSLTKELIPINTENFSWSERFYIIYNNITTIPKCIYCSQNTKYINIKLGYQPYCSKQCLYQYEINKIKESIISQGFTIEQKIDKISNNKIKIKCNKCGKELLKDLSDGKSSDIYCSGCYSDVGVSKEEKEILSYIKTIYTGEICENYRINNKELDIYLKKENLAIEYNGLYWHSYDDINIEQTKKYNHLNKTKLCQNHNIQLLHIFSNEWKNKNEIWKSIIQNKLNLGNKIFARKCDIKDVSNSEKNHFLNQNHLQGEDKSSIRLGLYYNDKLVSIMTFSKTRYNKNYEWEMVRFCTKLNTSILGGASKLLTHFEKTYKPKTLITYADKRYSTGVLYQKLGFKLSHHTQPNYFYWKSTGEIITRISAQKHKLPKLLNNNFNYNFSEAINMFNNNYRRIWDCGNLVFIKKYSNNITLNDKYLKDSSICFN